MFRKTVFCFGLVLALLVAIGGVALAEELPIAVTDPGRGPRPTPTPLPITVTGTVQSIDMAASRFVLRTGGGDVYTILVSERTRFVIAGVRDPGLDDLLVGDQVVVTGLRRTNGTGNEIEALSVVVRRPVEVRLYGTVAGFLEPYGAGFILDLRPSGQQVTVEVTRSTRYVIPGDPDPQFSDIRVGDRATVVGDVKPGTTNTIVARQVIIERQLVTLAGRVGEIHLEEPQYFMLLTAARGQVKVNVTRETRFRVPGVENPTLADVHTGDQAVVNAYLNGGPVTTPATRLEVTAILVTITRPLPFILKGQIVRIREDSPQAFWLQTGPQDIKKILVTSETEYVIPDDEDPSFEDLLVGDKATVRVIPAAITEPTTAAEETFIALKVTICRPQPQLVKLIGTITAKDETNGTFTLQVRSEELLTIQTDEDTKYRIPGVANPTFHDVPVGCRALVVARPEAGGLIAELVAVQRPMPRPGVVIGEIARKEVTATGEVILTVQTRAGDKVVIADAETRLRIPGVAEPTLDDLAVGQRINALGFWNDDGSLQAKTIIVLPAPTPTPTP